MNNLANLQATAACADARTLYAERERRMADAIARKQPDRVPIGYGFRQQLETVHNALQASGAVFRHTLHSIAALLNGATAAYNDPPEMNRAN